MKSIHRQILEQLRSGSRIVLATVISTSGSTPQKPGSSALFGENGLIAGTVGGGHLEGEVEHIAESVLISGISDWYYFNLDANQGEEGAICGGEAMVLIDANPGRHMKAFEKMEGSLSRREKGALLTMVGQKNDAGRAVEYCWYTVDGTHALPGNLDPGTKEKIIEQLSNPTGAGFTEMVQEPSEQDHPEKIFLEPITPLPHLIIAGAGHIGKALAHLGSLLDFEITVIDDRSEFANRENIPDADHLVVEDIGNAMENLSPGSDTYVVIVTRGHNHDAEALKPCIGTQAAYVGMIGSRNKVATMRKQFIEEGWSTPDQWSRIHTPIGINISSITVQEIAVSIAAQLVSSRNQNYEKHA